MTWEFIFRNLAPCEDLDWKSHSSEFRKFRAAPIPGNGNASTSETPSFLSLWSGGDSISSSQQPIFKGNLNLMNNLNNNNINESNSMNEPLKILTSEFAENLGLHSKDFDSGYLSPNNTNGYHIPGKPGLNVFPSGDVPKFAFGFGEETSNFFAIPSRSSPETLPFESNVSPPPMTIGYGRYQNSSPSSARASRPNSQDLDVVMQQPSGLSSAAVGGHFNCASPRYVVTHGKLLLVVAHRVDIFDNASLVSYSPI